MRLLIVMLVAVVFAGCSGYTPSERTGYDLACEALRADESMPASVKVLPIDEAGLYINKNAGHVVLHYTDNSHTNGKYVVKLTRVARTWKVDKK